MTCPHNIVKHKHKLYESVKHHNKIHPSVQTYHHMVPAVSVNPGYTVPPMTRPSGYLKGAIALI